MARLQKTSSRNIDAGNGDDGDDGDDEQQVTFEEEEAHGLLDRRLVA